MAHIVASGDTELRATSLRISNLLALDAKTLAKNVKELFPDEANVDDWRGMLASAPSAIVSMALCLLATVAEGADELIQTTDPTLSNFDHCCKVGMKAFKIAEEEMGKVAASLKETKDTMGTLEYMRMSLEDIVQFAKEKDTENMNLETSNFKELIAQLENDIQLCANSAGRVHKEFDEWYKLATSVRRVFTELEATQLATEEATGKQKSSTSTTESSSIVMALPRVTSLVTGKSIDKADLKSTSTVRNVIPSSSPKTTREICQEELLDVMRSGSTPAEVLYFLRYVLTRLLEMKKSLDSLAYFMQTIHTDINKIVLLDVPRLNDCISEGKVKRPRYVKQAQLKIMKIHIQAILAHAKVATYVAVSKKSIRPAGMALLTDLRVPPKVVGPYEILVEKLFDYAIVKGEEVAKFLEHRINYNVFDSSIDNAEYRNWINSRSSDEERAGIGGFVTILRLDPSIRPGFVARWYNGTDCSLSLK